MIRSFADKATEMLASRERVRKFARFENTALRKVEMLRSAHRLDDLREPPGNRLEALRGERAGQYSIRVNGQYRICFRWENGDAWDVEICDYH